MKDADDYIRVSTSVLKPDGSGRAIGIVSAELALERIKAGKAYYGKVPILCTPYMTGCEPIKDSSGNQIGIYYVGYEQDVDGRMNAPRWSWLDAFRGGKARMPESTTCCPQEQDSRGCPDNGREDPIAHAQSAARTVPGARRKRAISGEMSSGTKHPSRRSFRGRHTIGLADRRPQRELAPSCRPFVEIVRPGFWPLA